ncbi:bifunctional glutamate N-acetyltransferase/amino-acid acetyltransferase ArgJ [Candidatus Margulisiibacteriota bacterium]
MDVIKKGGITSPRGFSASGMHAGIKKSGNKDLALISSDEMANSAAVFTTNKVKAAPIIVSQNNIQYGKAKAIIANSGNANACTGEQGIEDAKQMTCSAASALRVPYDNILVASTGPIGKALPLKLITRNMRNLVKKLSKTGGSNAAEAILTTDLVKKEIAVQLTLNRKEVKIGGIAKGSGMIHPNMDLHATMFCFITTDAEVSSATLNKLLKRATDVSFNMVTVDKDTSTNDCVFALANGMSGCGKLSKKEEDKFYRALEYVCQYLAKEIARDGEGATKLLEIRVAEAKNDNDAREVARSVAGSDLVKSAIFGQDPNFGRIMAAVGYSKAEVDPNAVNLFIGENQVVQQGAAIPFNSKAVNIYMKKKEICITVELGLGKGMATAWGCDLTYDYVKINAKYST